MNDKPLANALDERRKTRRGAISTLGGWVDPTFLTPSQRSALSDHLSAGGITGERASRFLDSCAIHAQRVLSGSWLATPAVQRKSIRTIAKHAAALRDALTDARQPVVSAIELHAKGQPERHSKLIPLRLALADLVQKCDALRDLASDAAAAIDVDRQRSVAVEAGRGLAHGLLLAYRAQFGGMPAIHQRSWFVELCSAIGRQCGIQCGFVVVSAMAKEGCAISSNDCR